MPAAVSESSEEGRALLQSRVALFWKVMFFMNLLSSGLGALGAITKPSAESGLMLAHMAQAATLRWLTGDTKLTGATTLTGTPQYMAPESILHPDAADARADIYALGAVAYFLLAGSEVFGGTSIVEVCSQHSHQKPDPLSARGVVVPLELEAIVLACLEKDPDRRPQDAATLRRRLESCGIVHWDEADAHRWWSEHQADLDGARARSVTGEPKTLAIDGSLRPAA